ncbi:MAG: nucleotidyltransferase family protein [Phycisphaerales bacterium]|nr:nucleotidyltransferase family protein [Phycisphaerales bacterium]
MGRHMRALLLAAGMGRRLRPITDDIPKCLVPIHGTPLLGIWLEHLFERSDCIERVLLNTHYLAEQVENFVAKSPWADRIDLVYEEELLGTAGTLAANRGYFGDDAALVAHADNLTDFDVPGFIEAHRRRISGHVITMLAFETDTPETCGILECNSEGTVLAFHEKVKNPPGNLANAAVYVLEPEVLDFVHCRRRQVFDLSQDVIPHFLGRISSWKTDCYHRDIGSIESLRRAHMDFVPLRKG